MTRRRPSSLPSFEPLEARSLRASLSLSPGLHRPIPALLSTTPAPPPTSDTTEAKPIDPKPDPSHPASPAPWAGGDGRSDRPGDADSGPDPDADPVPLAPLPRLDGSDGTDDDPAPGPGPNRIPATAADRRGVVGEFLAHDPDGRVPQSAGNTPDDRPPDPDLVGPPADDRPPAEPADRDHDGSHVHGLDVELDPHLRTNLADPIDEAIESVVGDRRPRDARPTRRDPPDPAEDASAPPDLPPPSPIAATSPSPAGPGGPPGPLDPVAECLALLSLDRLASNLVALADGLATL